MIAGGNWIRQYKKTLRRMRTIKHADIILNWDA